nr:Ser-Thr-rich GPI-anchored membrane family protein [Rubritalea profundi]
MAEDYAPFNVNVTTDKTYDPDTYTGDKNKVGWLLTTKAKDKNNVDTPTQNGGRAYVGVFGNSNYATAKQPAWVTYDNLSGGDEDSVAEAASHEMGHNMGLSHDTTTSDTIGYYGGHGTGDTSWGPIMGTGFNRDVTQWSKGDYYNSYNESTDDDLAIISARVPYLADDYGDDIATATPWFSETDGSITQAGLIETTDDPDVFEFATGAGTVVFNANTFKSDAANSHTNGGNLDINLELRDSSGTLIALDNPALGMNASISQSVAAGNYFLFVIPSGAGSPLASSPTGYTSYGSLGQYSITGTIVPTDQIALTSPNGGEEWMRSTSQPVTWLSGMGGHVKIELFKGGSLDSSLAANTPNDGLFNWVIPSDQAEGTDYKIKITSIDQPSKLDKSSLNFSVLLESNDILIANMDADPGFSTTGLFEFGIPSGDNDAANTNTGTNIYDTDLDSTCFTASTLTTYALDCSNHSNVSLEFWAHTYLYPDYTAVFEVSNDNINWTPLLSQAGMSTRSWTKYSYNISSVADGQPTVYVRWSMLGSGTQRPGGGLAIDDAQVVGDFVPADDVSLTSPNGGENWIPNIQNQITWNSSMGGNVKIELLEGGSVNAVIALSTPNDGSYLWTAPTAQMLGGDYKVRIQSIENTFPYRRE